MVVVVVVVVVIVVVVVVVSNGGGSSSISNSNSIDPLRILCEEIEVPARRKLGLFRAAKCLAVTAI